MSVTAFNRRRRELAAQQAPKEVRQTQNAETTPPAKPKGAKQDAQGTTD